MKWAERKLREAIVGQCRWMNSSGLNQGTSGNISARCGDVMLVTPSATPYEQMTPEMVAAMPLAGRDGEWRGPLRPSTEWRFHRDILRSRPEAGAVVHTHSTYCTALAVTRRGIPPVHYMMAAFGGSDIRCAEYHTFGTAELSAAVLTALEARKGCLLANHGMITVGADLEEAMWLAVELETLARQYVLSLQLGGPVLLSETQVADAARSFSGYGLSGGRAKGPKGRGGGR